MLSYPTSAQNWWQVCLGGAWWTPACPWCAPAAARPPWKPVVFLGQCWALVGLSLDSYKSLLSLTAFGLTLTQVQQPWIVGWTGNFRADQHWVGSYTPGRGMPRHWVRVLKTANKNLVGKHIAVNRLEFFSLNKGSFVVVSSLNMLYDAPALPLSQKNIYQWWSISCIHNIYK